MINKETLYFSPSLQDATDRVTVEMIEAMTYGDEVELNADFTLSHYVAEDIIVIVLTEEWEELLQVMKDGRN